MSAEPAFFAQLAGGGSEAGPDAQTENRDSATGPESAKAVVDSESEVAPTISEAVNSPNPAAAPADAPVAKQAEIDRNLQVALRESRAELKELRAELAQLKASIPQPKPAEAPAEEGPDFLADPKGYVDGVKGAIKKLEDDIKSKEKTEAEQAEQQKQAQETWGKVLESEATFAAATPDYHQALAHVRGVRTQQLQLSHPDATPQQIAQQIQAEEFQGAAALLKQGRNPSEFYYNYAKTFGYKPATAPPPALGAKPDKDAVRTMGSGGGEGTPDTEEVPEGVMPEFLQARREMQAQFKRRAK